jgi:hypothetical protein
MRLWIGVIWLTIGTSVSSVKMVVNLWSIKMGEFLCWLSGSWLLWQDWSLESVIERSLIAWNRTQNMKNCYITASHLNQFRYTILTFKQCGPEGIDTLEAVC